MTETNKHDVIIDYKKLLDYTIKVTEILKPLDALSQKLVLDPVLIALNRQLNELMDEADSYVKIKMLKEFINGGVDK